MAKYGCEICGYIYDEQAGDSDSGIKANTAFDELPEDWICPDCGADKEQFSEA